MLVVSEASHREEISLRATRSKNENEKKQRSSFK